MLRDARCGCIRGRRRLFTMAFSQFREHTVLNLFDSKVENSVGRFFLQNSKRSKNVSKLTFLLLFYFFDSKVANCWKSLSLFLFLQNSNRSKNVNLIYFFVDFMRTESTRQRFCAFISRIKNFYSYAFRFLTNRMDYFLPMLNTTRGSGCWSQRIREDTPWKQILTFSNLSVNKVFSHQCE